MRFLTSEPALYFALSSTINAMPMRHPAPAGPVPEETIFIDLLQRTVNARRLDRARNEGSTGSDLKDLTIQMPAVAHCMLEFQEYLAHEKLLARRTLQ